MVRDPARRPVAGPPLARSAGPPGRGRGGGHPVRRRRRGPPRPETSGVGRAPAPRGGAYPGRRAGGARAGVVRGWRHCRPWAGAVGGGAARGGRAGLAWVEARGERGVGRRGRKDACAHEPGRGRLDSGTRVGPLGRPEAGRAETRTRDCQPPASPPSTPAGPWPGHASPPLPSRQGPPVRFPPPPTVPGRLP